jgi:hypothetical protein
MAGLELCPIGNQTEPSPVESCTNNKALRPNHFAYVLASLKRSLPHMANKPTVPDLQHYHPSFDPQAHRRRRRHRWLGAVRFERVTNEISVWLDAEGFFRQYRGHALQD